MVIILGDFK